MSTIALHRTRRAAPTWAVVAAHLVPFVTLPSGLWRMALAGGLSMGLVVDGTAVDLDLATSAYVVVLSLVAESAALLTLGLVRPWGERVPGWLPWIGGRRIAPWAVIAPAATGAVMLGAIWAFAFWNYFGATELRFASGGWEVVFLLAYTPLVLWAPLLGAVTYAYWRRRCG